MSLTSAVAIALALVLALTVYAGQQARAESTNIAFSANFLDGLFEYKADIDAKQLFPTEGIKDDIVGKLQERDYKIPDIEREFVGFKINASDIKIYIKPSKIDSANTRLSVDVEGKNVKVDSKYLNKKYDKVDIDTIYGIYNTNTDKVTIHVPYATALALVFRW
ncbi:hypothetical protein NTE_00818 [Candidatus Nitrososphaera evergladensis SR1]|jgi:hypothetical protein|uniref:Uncharacterized protein n=1 Tax=Candidatus Nitrososphaera evergladensis SR1 TaxID=1459636 RepID=A0A075MN20_9ARCH|nr:hypothetical protein [Candidatus Nitrososphaera evergladensis]AIF82896.1 hypothetical protein NTE_00818 [Candidatus Nitrososphaera evergladensis SR1]